MSRSHLYVGYFGSMVVAFGLLAVLVVNIPAWIVWALAFGFICWCGGVFADRFKWLHRKLDGMSLWLRVRWGGSGGG